MRSESFWRAISPSTPAPPPIPARAMIVRGAVEMVEMALKKLSERNVVELDGERRASMVSNLMVVLCSERDTQPIVNAGTLYT